MNLAVSEQLTFSTVRIECQLQTGEISTGTGFFFRFLESRDQHIPVIVTNKHVIEGANYGRFQINLADATGQPTGQHETITIIEFENGWIKHPDPNVDLCILPISEILRQFKIMGKTPFFIALDASLIPSPVEMEQLTALEEIIMIGYPNGIWDALNNKPIIRRGITATHPNISYEGRLEFMIDAACFPGSSGSPVFLYNLGNYVSRDGGTVIGSRIKLLGILYAGPQHTATGEIKIVNVPTQQKPLAISRIPNNLGLIIKSQRLMDFEKVLQDLIQKTQNN